MIFNLRSKTIEQDHRVVVTPPSMVPDAGPAPKKPALLSVDDAVNLPLKQMSQLFVDHLNPGQLHFMKLLGFHKVKIESAEGMYYTDQNGRKILDFFGGFGSLSLGHNHPRILAARKRFQDEKRHEIAMAFLSQYAAALAHNLAIIAPQDLDMVFLGSSGSEAMEAALKLAEAYQGPEKSTILYAQNAFHGKTKGALSITDSTLYQSQFKLVEGGVKVPFGDLDAIRAALENDPTIGIVCLEILVERLANDFPRFEAESDETQTFTRGESQLLIRRPHHGRGLLNHEAQSLIPLMDRLLSPFTNAKIARRSVMIEPALEHDRSNV